MSSCNHSCHRRTRCWHSLVTILLLWNWTLTYVDAAQRGHPERGHQLYVRYCAVCHGIEGTGTGHNAPYLEQLGRAPQDHTDTAHMNRLTDAELYLAISEGKRRPGEPPFMPWWGYTLREQDIWDLVAFIRSLAKGSTE